MNLCAIFARQTKNAFTVSKVKLEVMGLSSSHSQTGSFALVLAEEMGIRRLPIIIGMFEAQAIAIELEKIFSHRPMTHDLFKSFAKAFEFEVKEVVISDLREGIFYARICCQYKDGSNYVEVDARPSDAIAIALRFGAPVFALEKVLSEAGITISEAEETDKPTPVEAPQAHKETSGTIRELSIEELKTMLDSALADEDYEKAAKLRDEIKRREG